MIAALLLAACGPGDTGEPPEIPEAGPMWVAGDVHVHATGASNDTDDASHPEDIAAVAAERGLGFVVLTDHSNATGSMHCEDVEDCPNLGPEFPHQGRAAEQWTDSFVMAVGNELSPIETLEGVGGPVGHVGCMPPAGGFEFEGAFVDRPPGAVTGAEAVQQCRDAGGWAVVNHPFAPLSWIRFDWTTLEFDAMEVWNGGLRWDGSDERALWSWECLVAGGRDVVPIAASDCHRATLPLPGDYLDPPLGQPRTSVSVEPSSTLDWPTLREGLVAGRVVMHEAGTFLSAQLEGEQWTLRGVAAAPGRVEMRRILTDDCDATDPAGPHHEVVWQADVLDEFTEATGVEDVGDRLYAVLLRDDLGPSMEGDMAFTGVLSSVER